MKDFLDGMRAAGLNVIVIDENTDLNEVLGPLFKKPQVSAEPKKKYFAFTDDGEICPLGVHESLDDASWAADNLDRPCLWVMDQESVCALLDSINKALAKA